jgi:uncharacterized protein YndB with AHSA1/START domain
MDPHDFRPTSRADVRVERAGGRPTLVFERTFRHPPTRIWDALTDPAELREWSPFTADRNLSTTGPATLRMIDGDDVQDLPGTVTRAEPPSRLEYTWGDDRLVWELASEGPGTHLTLRHSVEADDWVPKVAAGWHLCFDVAEHLLDGDAVGPITAAAAMDHGWQELHDGYAADLGIEGTPLPEEHRAPR